MNTFSQVVRARSAGHGRAGHALVGACVAACLFCTGEARGYTVWKPGNEWEGNSIPYLINVSSFSALSTGLTNEQIIWWLNWGISNWKEYTGEQMWFDYGGSTNRGWQDDEYSVIMAASGCSPEGGCTVLAETDLVVDWYYDTFDEFDIRFYAGPTQAPFDWEVTPPSAGANMDFAGVATHEIGHALNLGHTANAWVMSPNILSTVDRYPTGDDYTGATEVQPPTLQGWIHWKKYSSTGWGTESTAAVPGWTRNSPKAAIGLIGTTPSACVGLRGANLRPYFYCAGLPLTNSSSWTGYSAPTNYYTYRPPAVAANKSAAQWVAAWANRWNLRSTSCPGATVETSTDGFASVTMTNLSGVCTVQDIALTHNPYSGRYVMMWVNRSTSSASQNDRVYASTSSNGTTWSTPADLGFTSAAAVGIACAQSGECLLTAPSDSSIDSNIVTRRFRVDGPNYQVVVDSAVGTHSDRMQREISAAATRNGTADRFLFAEHWSSSQVEWALGKGHFWTSESSVVPYSSFIWAYANSDSFHAPALAAGTSIYTDTYLFYTKY